MPGRLAGFAMLARRLDSFAQTREIIVIGMARRFVEVLDELMHARSLLGLSLGGLRVAGANAGGHAALAHERAHDPRRFGQMHRHARQARTSANSSPQSPRFVQNPAYTRSACATAARSTSSTRPNARRPSLGSAAATARANASVFPVRLSYTIA